mgnify:CR=1 FL=1
MFENLLNPVLNPLLQSMHPLLFTILIAFIVSLIVIFVYKLMTDQDLMKQLKKEMKELQKEMKELKDNPDKMMKVQKKAMETNMKYMGKSLKPTFITFIPLIIIFGWMHANLGFLPIMPEQQFTVTAEFEDYSGNIDLNVPEDLTIISNQTQKVIENEAIWTLKGKKGEYVIEYEFADQKYTQDLIISEKLNYAEPEKRIDNSVLQKTVINNKKLNVLNLGFMKLGWLGTYIIFSLIFSISLRKIFKIA